MYNSLFFKTKHSPLNSINLVANTWLAPYFLGETLTRTDIVATFIVIVGIILIVLFGSHDDSTWPLQTLIDNFSNTLFIIYASLVGGLLFISYLLAKAFLEEEEHRKNLAVGAVDDGTEVSWTRSVAQYFPLSFRIRFLPLQYACLAGALSAVNILMTKCLYDPPPSPLPLIILSLFFLNLILARIYFSTIQYVACLAQR
jgi:drug/metabolite transporter (DMT)-like permease